MNRRHILAAALPLAVLGACSTLPTPATLTTDTSAAVSAAGAITAIATDLQGIDHGSLTAENVTALSNAVTTLQAIASSLTSSAQPADVASAATAVSGVLADISTFLPSVVALLPLLTLVSGYPAGTYDRVLISTGGGGGTYVLASDNYWNAVYTKPKRVLTDAQIAHLKAHIAALGAAAAKAKAHLIGPQT